MTIDVLMTCLVVKKFLMTIKCLNIYW